MENTGRNCEMIRRIRYTGPEDTEERNRTTMENTQNLLLDFSHVYPEGVEKRAKNLKRIDMSDISGTDMYCSKEAEQKIRKRLKPYGPQGIHFLDNGNYHYMTKFFTEKIGEPFSLVLFDHHNDMQQPLIHELTSCGSWAGELLRENSRLKQMILIGPDPESIRPVPARLREKIICISVEESEEHTAEAEIMKINLKLPAYISVDKDVLNRYNARTNWNQGNMSVTTLKKLLREVFRHQKVIGVDICGECSLQEPFPEFLEDERINDVTNQILYHFLSERRFLA